MKTDLQIAQEARLKPIQEIATILDLKEEDLIPYGRDKAKIDLNRIQKSSHFTKGHPGKLVLVTAISPTPAGEGKTTTAIGLADAFRRIGVEKTVLALREPSMGPVFGLKGGATGGGYAQVAPMEAINLHFTGDFHAITAAHNLLAALIDNHIFQGNALGIDPKRILWNRVLDVNDRQLRQVETGLGVKGATAHGSSFDITVASEVMAIFCLASDLADLKDRLGRLQVAYGLDGRLILARDLQAQGAMAALLKEAFLPNLVQTLEGTPALIHGGPFANIAHGCNSVLATRTGLDLADVVVTEAGFGADLGLEKFLDIKARLAPDLYPDAVVLVASIRALKMHGGANKEDLACVNPQQVTKGLANLKKHLHTIKEVFGFNPVVALNQFLTDGKEEIDLVEAFCRQEGVAMSVCRVYEQGGEGAEDLALTLAQNMEGAAKREPIYAYELSDTIEEKLTKLVQKVYGGAGVSFSPQAQEQLETLRHLQVPICVAKTPYSFSDQRALVGAPQGFTIPVRALKYAAGAGFVIAYCGPVMTMPGLPAHPAALDIDVTADGQISGLF